MVAQRKIEQKRSASPSPAPAFEAWSEQAGAEGNPVHRLQRELAGGLGQPPARSGIRASAVVTVPLAIAGLCIIVPLSLFPALFDPKSRFSTRTILRTIVDAGREAVPALIRR